MPSHEDISSSGPDRALGGGSDTGSQASRWLPEQFFQQRRLVRAIGDSEIRDAEGSLGLSDGIRAKRRILSRRPNLTLSHMQDFTSEEELDTFEGWLKYQGIDAATLTPEQLAMWRGYFDDVKKESAATPKVGLMKLDRPDEHRYAVAIRNDKGLWLTLWVKKSKKGEFFVMTPRGDRQWDPHASYHLDGTFHMKSYGEAVPITVRKLQPLTGTFHGTAHLGSHAGHGTKIGAICDPAAFSGVVEVPSGVLGPRDGAVVVDLVEPGCEPLEWPRVVRQEVFRDFVPWLVIRLVS